MQSMLDWPSLRNIRAAPLRREGEQLLMTVLADMVIIGEDPADPVDADGKLNITVGVPCAYVRKHGEQKSREYIGKTLREEILTFAPISYQQFAHAVMDQVTKQNMESMAGEPFLFGLKLGRLH